MIILYGKLREMFGETIGAKVHSVQELVRAAEANRPGFRHHIKKDGQYVIRRGSDFRKAAEVTEEEVAMRFGQDVWHVLPMPTGYSGAARVVAGVVIMAVAYANPGGYLTGPMVTGMMGAGAGLALGGVATLLSPVPKVGGSDDSSGPQSFLFDSPVNQTSAGAAIPLYYGKDIWVGSIMVSGGLDVGDIK